MQPLGAFGLPGLADLPAPLRHARALREPFRSPAPLVALNLLRSNRVSDALVAADDSVTIRRL